MAASTSYFDFTKWRAERNPCLQPFVEYLKNGSQDPTRDPTIYSIDYAQSPSTQVEIRRTSLDEVLQHVNPSLLATTAQHLASASPLRRMVLVEDIDVSTIQTLGSRLDIDPLFFAHYIFTELLDITSSPPPPVLVSLPSTFMDKSSIHLHYQQILDLGQADPEAVGTYKFQAQGNVKRSVRCTPSISRTQPAILRGCCSAFLKHLDNGWICLLLVDPSTDLVPKKDSRSSDSSQKDIWQHIPFQGGFEDIVDPIPFSTFTTSSRGLNPIKNSILLNFLRYYEQRPPGLDIDNPNLLSLLYFPIRWVSSNWMLYVMLVNRYYKLYEYRMNQSSVESGLETSLIDLQRWRRRTKQSISKLILITAFIRLHLPSPEEDAKTIFHSHPTTSDLSNLCTILLSDYDHIIYEIKDYRNGIDFLISISTTMFQLRKAQQSVREAINIRRLTYVALFSAPFGLVAAVFSMSANFLPGQPDFWVFMITAMMATSVVAVVALTPGSLVRRACWATMMSARPKVLRAAPSCQRAGASKPAEAC